MGGWEGGMNWSVIQADCLELLREMPDACVDVTITDPPYDEHTHKNLRNCYTDGAKAKDLREAGQAYTGTRVKKIDPGFAPLVSYEFAAELVRVTRRWVLCFSALEQLGDYKQALGKAWIRSGIWRKCQAAPQLSGDRPANSCEGIVIAHREGKKRWNGHGKHAFWQASRERGERHHPCQKPVDLMSELIGLFSEPGETVFDPYAGSGSTGVAAIKAGRHFLGIEKEATWVETANKRLAEAEV